MIKDREEFRKNLLSKINDNLKKTKFDKNMEDARPGSHIADQVVLYQKVVIN